MYNELINKEKVISVIGLGYVGLPLALAFAKKFKVIGFDINKERVEMMKNKIREEGKTSEFRLINFRKKFSPLVYEKKKMTCLFNI